MDSEIPYKIASSHLCLYIEVRTNATVDCWEGQHPSESTGSVRGGRLTIADVLSGYIYSTFNFDKQPYTLDEVLNDLDKALLNNLNKPIPIAQLDNLNKPMPTALKPRRG